MATTEVKESYTVRETYTVESSSSGVMDPQYYKGIPGLLKAIEIISSLIAYICVETTIYWCVTTATFDYFKFVTMFCFATTCILYVILLFKLQVRILRCDCAKARWPIFELGFYIGVLIFYFFADLFLSLHGCVAAHKAGCFFGWVAFAAYIIDTVFIVYAFIRGRSLTTTQTTITSQSSPDSENRY